MRKYIIGVICCMALGAGCRDAEEPGTGNERFRMSLEADIGSLVHLPDSRYSSSDDTPNNLSFDAGESIGMFMEDGSVVKWTKENDAWKAETAVYWPDNTNPYDFYAYYPYVEADSEKEVLMPSLTGQNGTVAGLSDFDFLVASTSQSYATNLGVVSFTGNDSFGHMSSLLAITVNGTGELKTSVVKKITLEAEHIASATTYSFETETVSFKKGGKLDKMESVNMNGEMQGKDRTFYFIVNSGIDLNDVTIGLKYSTGGVNYKASKTGLGNVTLMGGSQYSFSLNVTDGILSITGGDVADWGNGGEMDDIIINKSGGE